MFDRRHIAESEMIDGYLDGLRPENPAPGENRGLSYRHGFLNARADLAGKPRAPAAAMRVLADKAIEMDCR